MKIKNISLGGIFPNGTKVMPGEETECSDKAGKALIKLGKAEQVKPPHKPRKKREPKAKPKQLEKNDD